MVKIYNEVIFSILRILKGANNGDLYYDNYLFHLKKYGETFFDVYHLIWAWVIEHKPKRILEIGTRTGISICQLLSAYIDSTIIERIILCDIFSDGFISPELVKMNMKHLNIHTDVINKVEFLIGDSKTTIKEFIKKEPDYKFDYILVDGSHEISDAKQDLENVKPLVAKGGIILFDDIAPDGMSLDPVWQEFKGKYKEEFEWNENYSGKGVAWAIKR